MMNIYELNYKKSLKRKKINFFHPAENFLRIFRQHIKKNKMYCLDFGAGDGRHTEFLLNEKNKVLATDITKYAKLLTKKRIRGFKNFLVFKKEEEYFDGFGSKKFDLINCWETIHWISDFKKINRLLELFYKSLKKNGKLIITFPTEKHYVVDKNNKVSKFVYKASVTERKGMLICNPPISNIKKTFKEIGFSIEGIYRYDHGRIIKSGIQNELSSANITNKLFSMYAFILKK